MRIFSYSDSFYSTHVCSAHKMHGVVLPTRNDRKRIIIDMFHKLALEVCVIFQNSILKQRSDESHIMDNEMYVNGFIEQYLQPKSVKGKRDRSVEIRVFNGLNLIYTYIEALCFIL